MIDKTSKKIDKTIIQRAAYTREAVETRSRQDRSDSQVANPFLTHTFEGV